MEPRNEASGPKGANTIPASVAGVRVVLRWLSRPGTPDVDASTMLLTADGREVDNSDILLHNQRRHTGGPVRHRGKSRDGEETTDTVDIDLNRLPKWVDKVFLRASLGADESFAQVEGLQLLLFDIAGGPDTPAIEHRDITDPQGGTTLLCGELSRHSGHWAFFPIRRYAAEEPVLDTAVAYVCKYVVRVAEHDWADKGTDRALSVRVYRLISIELGSDPVLLSVIAEVAAGGRPSAETRRRLREALAARMTEDERFHALLTTALDPDRLGSQAPAANAGGRVVAVYLGLVCPSQDSPYEEFEEELLLPLPNGSGSARQRFLVADATPAARLRSVCSLVVSILANRPAEHGRAARALLLPPEPQSLPVTIVAQPTAGLVAEEALDQVVQVPPSGDSAPVRFPFRAVQEGLQKVRITAWAGGSFLGELTVEISVHSSARAGAPHRVVAAVPSLQGTQGEVTLQITSIDGRPAFQIISEPYLGRLVHAESLIGTPGDAVERAISTLRDLAVGRSSYSARTARRWMREVGNGLWRQMVPDVVKEEFWELWDRTTTFTIAADDNIPWELLYPLAPGRDEGFLVERLPVLRRARGQGRARSLQLSDPHFVVSAKQPKAAAAEIAAIQSIIGAGATINTIEDVLGALDSGDLNVAHFACHNAFQHDGGGSRIDMAGGPLVPEMLNSAAALRSLAARSPIVFLNACRSAGAVPEYTQMMGWAEQFLGAGAGAFLGTLWAVRSDKASSFATTFYSELADGQPLGQAVLAARRQAAAEDGDPTWLAYTAYGDPAATTAHTATTAS